MLDVTKELIERGPLDIDVDTLGRFPFAFESVSTQWRNRSPAIPCDFGCDTLRDFTFSGITYKPILI
jgi:hypothetical protein